MSIYLSFNFAVVTYTLDIGVDVFSCFGTIMSLLMAEF